MLHKSRNKARDLVTFNNTYERYRASQNHLSPRDPRPKWDQVDAETFPGRFVHRSLTMTAFSMVPVPFRATLCTSAIADRPLPTGGRWFLERIFGEGGGRERRTRELYSRVKAPAQFGFVDPQIGRTYTYTHTCRLRALSLFSCFAFVRSFTFTSSLPQGSTARSSRPYVFENRTGAWNMYVCVRRSISQKLLAKRINPFSIKTTFSFSIFEMLK